MCVLRELIFFESEEGVRGACFIALNNYNSVSKLSSDVFLSYRFRCAGLVGTISNTLTYFEKRKNIYIYIR